VIYIHVPFCASHCTYCAFYSELLHRRCAGGSDALCTGGSDVLSEYVEALCREIEHEAAQWTFASNGGHPTQGPHNSQTLLNGSPQTHSPQTLYFGGGTPSLLSLEHVERILGALSAAGLPLCGLEEFTFEVNPEDIVEKGLEYARGLRELGVSRISMGVQSFNDEVLRRMGRRHRNAQSVKAFSLLREAGFDNISIDLIFGFEKEFIPEVLRRGLLELSGCSGDKGGSGATSEGASIGMCKLPEHISCYQLGVEQGSGLEKMLDKGLWTLPEDDQCAERYAAICAMLQSLGYEHYEISNWAKPGRRSRHNSGYWRHAPYLGLGPGAHSLFVGEKMTRRWNNPDLKAYLASAAVSVPSANPAAPSINSGGSFSKVRGEETLTPGQIREEEIFLGLRTSEGISEELISASVVQKHVAVGDLVRGNVRLRIPEDKWFISDNIIENLI